MKAKNKLIGFGYFCLVIGGYLFGAKAGFFWFVIFGLIAPWIVGAEG